MLHKILGFISCSESNILLNLGEPLCANINKTIYFVCLPNIISDTGAKILIKKTILLIGKEALQTQE